MSICDQNKTKEVCSKDKDKQCDYNNFKRARYFHGMLMTDRDFREEQIYLNEKRKLLNRMVNGWGVVCGLRIKQDEKGSPSIIIEGGLAFDCAGNEILVCDPYKLNVVEAIKSDPSPKEACGEIKEGEQKWYIVIRYKEVCTDPVPVYAPGGGCEEKVCEYSRIREGYCFDLRQTVKGCPKQLQVSKGPCSDDKKEEGIRKFLCEDLLLTCSDNCCDNPYVVLGSITFDGNIGPATLIKTDMINNWDCRKYVITFNLLQHWMTLLAPQKVPFETIVDYASYGVACKNTGSAVEAFNKICPKEDTPESKGYIVSTYEEGPKLIVKGGLDAQGKQNKEHQGEISGGSYYAKVGNLVAMNGKPNILARLVPEQKEKETKILTKGDTWDVGESWKLRVENIDDSSTPRQVSLELLYNNIRAILWRVGKEELCTYNETIHGEPDVPLFLTYVENIFEAELQWVVVLKYTWAISKDIIAHIPES